MPTTRSRRCSTARSRCGTACRMRPPWPARTASPCSRGPGTRRARSATRAAISPGSRPRSRSSDPRAEPSRAARILEATARAQRHLNRAAASAATLERALELADDDATRAGVLAALARAHLLLDDNADAARTARAALELATASGLPLVEGRARNTLGSALATTGQVDEAEAELRAAIEIAREHDAAADLAEGYLNYANMLHAVGRTEAACAVVAEGKDVVGGQRPIAMLWLDLNLAEFAFEGGDWAASEAALPSARPWTGGQSRVGIGLRRAALAAGRGDHAAANALLDELEPLAADSSEPQILRLFGALVAELRRRDGDLEQARAAVETGLGRIDGSTDDPMAGWSLAACGVTVEADTAQRARDLGDDRGDGRRAAPGGNAAGARRSRRRREPAGRAGGAAGRARRGGPRRRPSGRGGVRAGRGGLGLGRSSRAGRGHALPGRRGARRRRRSRGGPGGRPRGARHGNAARRRVAARRGGAARGAGEAPARPAAPRPPRRSRTATSSASPRASARC